jgi:hypothetical protein
MRWFAVLLLALCLIACGDIGIKADSSSSAAGLPTLTEKNGRWLSTTQLVRVEWTFHEDGKYDALHQEGEVAAQVRGTWKLNGSTLTIDPEDIEARSTDSAEADRVRERIDRGLELTLSPSGEGFDAKPADGRETMKFERM